MEQPALPVLAQREPPALAVSAQQAPQVQELQAPQVQQESAPQALQVLPAFKGQQVRVSMEPQALPASLGPLAYKAPLVLALTALRVQRAQPVLEQQVQLARLALRGLKAQQAPSASALAQPGLLVLVSREPPELKEPREFRGPRVQLEL